MKKRMPPYQVGHYAFVAVNFLIIIASVVLTAEAVSYFYKRIPVAFSFGLSAFGSNVFLLSAQISIFELR